MFQKQLKKLKITSLVLGIVAGLILLQLLISHRLATWGEDLRQLEAEEKKLEEENSLLAEEISQAGSLSRVMREAEALGLNKSNQVLHLTPQVPVALETFGRPPTF